MAGAALAPSVLLLATAPPAFGVVLGDIELRSSLGQPLRAWIPYALGPGERLDAACVRLLPGTPASADIPALVTAKATLLSQGGYNYIVLESARPTSDLFVRVIVDLRCGPSVRTTREYVLLPDQPEQVAGPAPQRNPVSGAVGLIVGPVAAAPSAGALQTPAAPLAESPPVPARTNGAAASPKSPNAAGVPHSPPRQKARSVVRVAPTLVEEDVDPRASACCFRLSYELSDRGPPPSEAERERLRQEMRDPATRLQTLRDEAGTLKGQLVSTAQKLENAEVLGQQRARTILELRFYGVLAAIALVLLGFGAFLWWRMRRQPDAGRNRAYAEPAVPVLTERELLTEPELLRPPELLREPEPLPTPSVADTASPPRVDFELSKDVPETRFAPVVALPPHIAVPLDPALRAAEYKKAYILGRFPEIAAGNIVLGNPASVIEAARIFYQDDHNPAKAVELLRIALATDPEQVRLWLALFEILSLESMAGEFADLAERYYSTCAGHKDSHWPRIAALGRALEPGNPLYRGDDLPPVDRSNPNWLNSPLDMMGDALALELRTRVLESHHAA